LLTAVTWPLRRSERNTSLSCGIGSTKMTKKRYFI
jgi:hypothetical protein